MDAKVKVLEKRNEARDTKSFILDKPHGFSYVPGQYIMIMIGDDDHFFTLSSSPTEDFLMVTMRMGSHEFKQKLDQQHELSIRGPIGKFSMGEGDNHVFLAGGIGITPFRSMIKNATDKKSHDKITLIYSNKAEAEIAFKKDFEDMARRNHNFKLVETVTRPEESPGWHGLTGRVDEKMIREHSNEKSIFYVCGPPAMVDGMVSVLKAMNVQDERIKLERFTGY